MRSASVSTSWYSLAFTNAITADRVATAFDLLPSKRETLRKALEAFIVTLPLIAGAAVAFRKTWLRHRVQALTLLFAAAASLGCYVVLRIPHYANEYKFIFTAAICLFPFLTVALEPAFHRLGRWAVPAMAIATILVALPARDGMFRERSWLLLLDAVVL